MEVSALQHAGVAGMHGRSPLLRLQSDERLIALVRRGNHGAFEALVSRYQARLLAFCRHMLGSREDAEDVLQEVFAAAFNAILADERTLNVRPWLYRIARNRSLNHLRRAKAIGVDSMDVHLSEGGLTTAEKVHRREDFRMLLLDVQSLPETQRTALLLREIDALSYEQISEAMETTVPSVKSLLVRARVSLAEAAEARMLSCEDVRLELGAVAEGLQKVTPPVRRHLKTCERCATFRGQLRETNKALAAVFPVGPLLLIKKLVLAHLGTSATAGGGGSAAGSAAAGSAAAGSAAAGSAAAGSAAVGSAAAGSAAGGIVSAGVGAVATKAAAGIAAAAIVTAGAVEVKRVAVEHPHRQPVAAAPAAIAVPAAVAQARDDRKLSAAQAHADALRAATKPKPAPVAQAAVTAPATTPVTTTPTAAPTPPPAERKQVDSETTTLPSTDQKQPPPSDSSSTQTTTTTPSDSSQSSSQSTTTTSSSGGDGTTTSPPPPSDGPDAIVTPPPPTSP